MNSLLQQLFMLPIFSNQILNCQLKKNKDLDTNLLFQLKVIFGILREGTIPIYNAAHLLDLIKDYDESPLSIYEQHDADEFLNLFFERLEGELSLEENHQLIPNIFQGKLTNKIQSSECDHISESEEPFLSLAVQVKGKNQLYESLDFLIENDKLEGSNAYYCNQCKKRVKAIKTTIFNTLPEVLIVVLKRFEYDITAMRKKKLNSRYEFPTLLSMERYCHKQDKEKSYYEYCLRGVLLHNGSGSSGHYTSLARNNDNDWYEFNDTTITPFDIGNLDKEAFGGQEVNSDINFVINEADLEMLTKLKSAYLLIYEKTSCRIDGELTLQPEVKKCMEQEQLRYYITNSIVNHTYINFINKLMKLYPISQDQIFPAKKSVQELKLLYSNHLEMWKFFITFFAIIILRIKNFPSIQESIISLKRAMDKNKELSIWVIATFSNPKILQEFFVDCPSTHSRFWLVSFLLSACSSLPNSDNTGIMNALKNFENIYDYLKTKGGVESFDKKGRQVITVVDNLESISYILILINNLLCQWNNVIHTSQHLKSIGLLLSRLAREIPLIRKFLLKCGLFELLLELIMGDTGTESTALKKLKLILFNTQPSIGIQKKSTKSKANIKRMYGSTTRNSVFKAEPTKAALNKLYTWHKFLLDLFCLLWNEHKLSETNSSSLVRATVSHISTGITDKHIKSYLNDYFIVRLIQYSYTTTGCESALSIVGQSCDNIEFCNRTMKFLVLSISSKEPEELYVTLSMLRELLRIKDALQIARISCFEKWFGNVMEKTLKESYLSFSLVIDMFIETAVKCEVFRKQMKIKFEAIHKWLNNNLCPNPKNMYWYKITGKLVKVWHKVSEEKKCVTYNKNRAAILKILLKTVDQKQQALIENHKLIPIGKWVIGSMTSFNWNKAINTIFDIKYFNYKTCRINNNWTTGKLINVIEGMAHFEYKDPANNIKYNWIRLYSDKIAPLNSVTKNPTIEFYKMLIQCAKRDEKLTYSNSLGCF